MSRLDELIAELCPNGVEYKSIGEISTDIYRGSSIIRDQVTKEGTPCVRYGEIYTTYGVWFDQCVSHTNVSKISNAKYFEHGDILFAITGESVEDIAKSCAYVGYEKCLAGGDIVVLKHKEDALSSSSENKPLIMRFAPWNYSNKDNLISIFFQNLKNTIELQDNEELKRKNSFQSR